MIRGRLVAATAAMLMGAVTMGCSASNPGGSDGSGQTGVLEDSVVSEAEYRLSVEAEAACVEAEGWETSEIRLQSDGVILGFSVRLPDTSGPPREDLMDEASAVQDRCYDEHLDDVERAYFRSKIPTGAERDAMFDKLLKCLGDAGLAGLSRSNSEEEIVGAIAKQYPDSMEGGLVCVGAFPLVFPEGMFPE